jgi:superfamily II DNA or RNA helicase
VNKKRTFVFDAVFNMEIGQDTVYQQITRKLIDSYFDGYNATIMAYGQTGSGKTHTMGNGFAENYDTAGIIPRTISEVSIFINF